MKLGIVWLHRSVLNAVDRRRGEKSRSEFIAQAVAHECARQGSGRGVIIEPLDGEPRYTPPGLIKPDPQAEQLRDTRPIFPLPDMDYELKEGEDG